MISFSAMYLIHNSISINLRQQFNQCPLKKVEHEYTLVRGERRYFFQRTTIHVNTFLLFDNARTFFTLFISSV